MDVWINTGNGVLKKLIILRNKSKEKPMQAVQCLRVHVNFLETFI